MKRLVEFPLEEGGTILVEVDVDESEEGGIVPAARPDEVVTKANQTFEKALERVKPAASAILAKLRSLSDPPDEIEVQFGLKLSAEAGVVVASAAIEANYTVTLKWIRS